MNRLTKVKPPIALYEAASTLALLTAAALEGAGLAMNEAIKEGKMSKADAKSVIEGLGGEFGIKNKLNQAKSQLRTQAQTASNIISMKGGAEQQEAKIGESSTGQSNLNLQPGAQEIAKVVMDLASKGKTIIGDTAEVVGKTSYKVASDLIQNAIDRIIPVDLLDKPYSQINPELTAQVQNLGENLKLIAQDPEARAAVQNLAKAAADVGLEAVDAVTPQINRLVNKVWEVANRVGTKSVRNAMNIGLSMLITAISGVPVVGGVVVGSLEAGNIFNKVVETGSEAVSGFMSIASDATKAQNILADSIGKSETKLAKPIEQAKQAYQNIQQKAQMMKQSAQSVASMAPTLPTQSGGKALKMKKKRIQARLGKSIRKFMKPEPKNNKKTKRIRSRV